MRPEEVVELFKNVVKDSKLVFMAIEELRLLGYNVVHFIAGEDVDELVIYITFMYSQLDDELTPIAIAIEFHNDLTKKMHFTTVSDFVRDLNGYIFGSSRSSGILIPISTAADLEILVNVLLPKFLSRILGKEVRLSINRYELEYMSS